MTSTWVFVFFLCLKFSTNVLCQSEKQWSRDAFSYCMTADLNASYTDPNGVVQVNYGEKAKFGECQEVGAFGVLVHVTSKTFDQTDSVDHKGCTLPFHNNLPTEKWIALIQRGVCNFEVKVKNAFDSNASGVIVYDDKVSLNLQKMKLSTNNISAVFTFKNTGDALAELVDAGNRVSMSIKVGNPCERPYNLNRTSVLFVSISFIILMLISLAWLIFYYVQRFRYIHAKDRMSRRLGSAAKKALSKIPTKNVKLEDNELQGDGECCAVCIEIFKIGEVLRILPCKHEFHKTCIDPWLLEHRTCPMCKMDILKHYGFVFTGSQESILHLDLEEAPLPALSVETQTTPQQQEPVESSTAESEPRSVAEIDVKSEESSLHDTTDSGSHQKQVIND